uniref:Uncharacterized protein n=1 Tax=Periophthalmus magnuspinnatus TaxID=409849 RepID=A0A3B4B5R3_9GOBI
MSVGGCAC